MIKEINIKLLELFMVRILNNRRQGTLSEILANYLIANVAFVSNPILNNNDIGIDMYCTLFETKLIKSIPYNMPIQSFGLQIKSSSNSDIEENMTKYLDFLPNLEIPLYFGIVNKQEAKMDIHSCEGLPFLFSHKGEGIENLFFQFVPRSDESTLHFERMNENGEKEYVLKCPKVVTLSDKTNYYQEKNLMDDFKKINRIYLENLQRRSLTVFVFKTFWDTYTVYSGSGSLQSFMPNFMTNLEIVLIHIQYLLKQGIYPEDLVNSFLKIKDVLKEHNILPQQLEALYNEIRLLKSNF